MIGSTKASSAARVLLVLLCITLGACDLSVPEGPRINSFDLPPSIADQLAFTLKTSREDLNANGLDVAKIEAVLTDAAGRKVAGEVVFFSITSRGFTGRAGTLGDISPTTDAEGMVKTSLVAPSLAFVPTEAAAVVTASLPPTATRSASASIAIALAPKGGSTDPPNPVIQTLLPKSAPKNVSTEITVLGEFFLGGDTVTFVIEDFPDPIVITPSDIQPGQLVIDGPTVITANTEVVATVFVSSADGATSNTVEYTFK